MSLHTYINSLSSLFVVFFSYRWDIFWFSSTLRAELTFKGRNLYLRGSTLTSMTLRYMMFSLTTTTFRIVGEFSLVCCTSMAHAGNTKIWAKIISAYTKKCSITGFSSLRGGEGGGGGKTATGA